MSRARNGGCDVRFGALLAAGALTLHQLRYLLADGDAAGAALRNDGHAYLSAALVPILVFAAALVAASLLRAMFVSPASGRRSFGRYVAALVIGMLAIFVAQETLEGVLASGHASGLTAAVAAGGWLAAPIAVALAAPLAAIGLVLDRLEDRLSQVFVARLRLPRAPAARARTGLVLAGRPLELCNLAFGFARRPPPLPAQ